ncbi:MAG: lysostaphin resistance A-like protein [Flavobacteriaceae bacterium]
MFIQRLEETKASFWKFLLIPILFFALMGYNFWVTISSPVDTTIAMNQMIDMIGSTTTLFIILLPLVLGFWILLVYGIIALKLPATKQFTGRHKIDWSRIGFSFLIWSLVIVVSVLVEYFLAPDHFIVQFDFSTFWPFLIVALLMIPFQTSFEELMFRGHLTQSIGYFSKRRLLALIIPSVLFGLTHIANPEVEKLGYGILAYYIGSGFFFAIMTLADEGIELALGTHAANNLIGALLISADWTAFNVPSVLKDVSEPSFGLDALLPLLVVYPLILYVFSKKYQWKNTKQKLFGSTDNDAF